jgi:hypothetical protein
MEFSIVCPNDGTVEVSLEDVSSIVFHGFESVDVVFTCPRCGTEVDMSAKIPNMLITTLDLSEMLERSLEGDETVAEIVEIVAQDDSVEADAPAPQYKAAPLTQDEEERIERYCEYFRRQLAGCDTVERFLSEVDAP